MSPAAALAALSSPTASLISSPFPSKLQNISLSLHYNKQPPVLRPTAPFTITPLAASAVSNPAVLLHELGLAETQIDLLLQNYPQLDSSPPQSLHRRIAQLQSLKLTGPALHRTIARCPAILTSPELDPFLDFIHRAVTGLDPDKLERMLVSANPQILAEFISKCQLLLDHGLPEEKLGHIINNVNVGKVFGGMPLQELEEMLLFLQCFGWPDIVLRRSAILNLDLHAQLVPRVEFLIELADGDEAAAKLLIGKLPGILAYTVEHHLSHLQFWRSVGLSKEQVFKIALVYPNVFSVSRDRKLKPRVEFLMQCDLNAEDIFKFLIKAPTFLSLSYEKNLSKKLCFLIKIGYKHRTRELAAAVGAATRTSCENMQLVVAMFLSYGFSCEDLLTMSKKHPQVLQYSHESLEKKMEFLIVEMERDIGELMAFPAFLGYKLDDRIKHRYEAKKEVRGKGMSLNKLLSVSTKRFDLKK